MSDQPERGSPLAMKLAEVMEAVTRIPKHGWNAFHNYAYPTEADTVEAVRGELAKRHVALLPAIIAMHRHPIGEKGMVLTTIEMEFTFIDGESGERETRAWLGAGSDREDKGVYKAMTGAAKYFLLKTFLIPTGDDPEDVEVSDAPARAPVADEPPHPAGMDDEPPHPAEAAQAPKAAGKPAGPGAPAGASKAPKAPTTVRKAPPPPPAPGALEGAVYVVSVSEIGKGTNDYGPWTRYAVLLSNGKELTTFNETLAERAAEACKQQQHVVWTVAKDGKKLTALHVAA